jgi:hypothetical protein
MVLEILNSGRPLSEAALADVERKLGYRLPGDYRAWIAQHNGGLPRPAWFLLGPKKKGILKSSAGDWRHMDSFFELENPAPLAMSALSMRSILREGRGDEPVLPRRLLPIGNVDDGLHLLLSLDGADAGCVYVWTLHADEFWDVEHDEDGEPLDTELIRVAGSFSEFVSLLAEPPAKVKKQRGMDSDEDAAFDPRAYLAQLPETEREEARLQMLIMAGTAESARQAMDEGLSPEKVLLIAETFGNRDLADAARERLGNKPIWPAAEGFSGAFWSDPAAVRRRLEEGASINGPTPDDSTPLHGAAAAGCIESVRLLIEAGADPAARNAAGRTPLHAAAAGPDRADAVSYLLDHGAQPGVFDNDGEMALHKAAGLSGCLETMKRLIDAGEDLHARPGGNRAGPIPEGTSDLLRQSLAQIASLGNPFDLPPPDADDDPEIRAALEQLSASPMAQFARRIMADPDAFLQQHQLQVTQGRTAAEVLQMRLVPVGDRTVPGSEVLRELEAYRSDAGGARNER